MTNNIYQAPMPHGVNATPSMGLFLKPVNAIVRLRLLPQTKANFFPNLSRIFTNVKSFNKKLEAQKTVALQNEGAASVQVKTGDGALIDGMYFSSVHKKAILYVGGQNERYELGYKKMRDLKREMGDPALLVFNPRGVGQSKGDPNGQTLATDVYSAFRYLVDVQGMDPNDIVIFGHSLGGGYGAEGAKLVQEAFPDKHIHFVSHNSFNDFLDFFHKKLRWKWLQKLIFPLIEKIMEATRWQLNSIDALRTLKGKKLIIVNQADEVISYNASLYKGIKQSGHPFEFTGFKMDSHEKMKKQHSRRFNAGESSSIAFHMANMLHLACPERTRIIAHLHQLENALVKGKTDAAESALKSLETIQKEWDGCSNMAHVLFKRIYYSYGENSSDPEFGRQAFAPGFSDEAKLDIVRMLKSELAAYWPLQQ